MSRQELLDNIANLPAGPSTVSEVPPPELVGFFVALVRGLREWKQSTLAEFAGVSLTTVERVERGEKVRDESLDQIAVALGYERGYFTSPRTRCSIEEAQERLFESLGHLEPVPVKPMRTQRSIREAAQCHAFMVHRPGVPERYDADIESLVEWLDLASFILSSDIAEDAEVSRRDLYSDILECVRGLERRGITVMSGVLPAPVEGIHGRKIALLSITSKLSDPGAFKRPYVFVDRRVVAENSVTNS